ncbi:MAG: AMP-binding protein [Bacteroidales bacterium]
MKPRTLNKYFDYIMDKYPDKSIIYFKDDGSADEQLYTQLKADAYSVAANLQQLGLKKSDKIIICTEGNKNIVNAFWGCIVLGVVPTIIQAPIIIDENNPVTRKVLNVYNTLNKPFLICNNDKLQSVGISADKIILNSDLSVNPTNTSIINNSTENEVAYIQFSSGSTGDPKGILLTHKNVIINYEDITNALKVGETDHVLSWMPLYHDMGLVGLFISTILIGATVVNIETTDFIKNPKLWIDAMSKYKADISGSPNFGLNLLVRFLNRKNELYDWDLSNMRALLNGAEPISVEIMNNFNDTLHKYKFRRNAMMPVYGLAEATLAVTFTPLLTESYIVSFLSDSLDSEGLAVEYNPEIHKNQPYRRLSSVGVPLNNVEIKIIDDNSNELAEAIVGNIMVKGDAVSIGYYKIEDKQTFQGDWLNTGDLGFTYNGHLFICGRKKDILFLNGKKYFSNDLEDIAVEMCNYTLGKVAIVGNNDYSGNTEEVIIFASGIKVSEANEWLAATRKVFNAHVGVRIDKLVIIRSNQFPKTSSGKMQRYLLIKDYNNNAFENVFS